MKQQITHRNRMSTSNIKVGDLVQLESCADSLTWWMAQYFKYEIFTTPGSQRAQLKNILIMAI